MLALHFIISLSMILWISYVKTCSPPNNYRPVGLIGRSILAPNIIIAKVDEIKSDGDPYFVPYIACVTVERVLKNITKLPEKLCIGEFGGEELCLLHVEVNKTYVMFLNRDNSARYDDLHGAAHLAVEAVTSLIETAICKDTGDCERPSLVTKWQKTVVVKEGKDLDLVCRPSGTSPFLITWFWNNNNLGMRVLTTTENKLQIKKISSRWSGQFTCVVRSPAGEISRSTQVYVDPIPCGGHLVIDSTKIPFGISSLNFPARYPKDKTCTWRICPPNGHKLKLRFTDFALVGMYDDVEIAFECSKNKTIQRVLWGRFCGTTIPGSVISTCKSNCIVMTHHARSGKLDYEKNLTPAQDNGLGFKATFQPVKKEEMEENYTELLCRYDFIVKGRVKTNGIVSLIIDVLETYVPMNKTLSKELRLHYRYPLTDQRRCPVSVVQEDVYVFLGQETDVFLSLIDIFHENEIRHRWVTKLKSLKHSETLCRG